MPAGRVRYVATARVDPADTDFGDRIAEHRRRRPAHWVTVESATGPGLASILRTGDTPTLVDDLGTWLTVELDAADAWLAPRGTIAPRCADLVDAVAGCAGPVVLVSPEVGLGVIPETRSGRLFRDEVGALNGLLAQVCDEVRLAVAGLTIRLK